MSLNVRIITPEKVFLTSETEQVVLPSITGGVGILKGHAPLVTILEAGVLRYKNNGTWTPAVLYGGFAEVEDDQVTVLVNGAEEVSEKIFAIKLAGAIKKRKNMNYLTTRGYVHF